MQKIEKNNITWINFSGPTTDELLFLKDNFKLSKYVVSELSQAIKRPKIEEYDGYLFLILHFPVFNEKTRQTIPTELDFIIAQSTIVTVHQESLPQLENFFHECSGGLNNGNGEYFKSPGFFLYCLLDKLIDSCLPMLDHISEHIEDIENNIFKGREKEMISEVAIVKRDIIDFRQTIKPQRSVLEVLANKTSRFFNDNLDFISQEVIGSNIRVWNVLENHKEMIEAIEETNNSLFSYRISEIVKILTILSLITFPLNLINGFLGMSLFNNVGFMQSPSSYILVLIVEIFIALLMVLFFKKKRWL